MANTATLHDSDGRSPLVFAWGSALRARFVRLVLLLRDLTYRLYETKQRLPAVTNGPRDRHATGSVNRSVPAGRGWNRDSDERSRVSRSRRQTYSTIDEETSSSACSMARPISRPNLHPGSHARLKYEWRANSAKCFTWSIEPVGAMLSLWRESSRFPQKGFPDCDTLTDRRMNGLDVSPSRSSSFLLPKARKK